MNPTSRSITFVPRNGPEVSFLGERLVIGLAGPGSLGTDLTRDPETGVRIFTIGQGLVASLSAKNINVSEGMGVLKLVDVAYDTDWTRIEGASLEGNVLIGPTTFTDSSNIRVEVVQFYGELVLNGVSESTFDAVRMFRDLQISGSQDVTLNFEQANPNGSLVTIAPDSIDVTVNFTYAEIDVTASGENTTVNTGRLADRVTAVGVRGTSHFDLGTDDDSFIFESGEGDVTVVSAEEIILKRGAFDADTILLGQVDSVLIDTGYREIDVHNLVGTKFGVYDPVSGTYVFSHPDHTGSLRIGAENFPDATPTSGDEFLF